MKMQRFLIISVLVSLFIAGCASRYNLATIRNSQEAEQHFLNGQVKEYYSYYYFGPERRPIALLALDKNYVLNSEFWHQAEMDDQTLQHWINLFKHDYKMTSRSSEYKGKEIVSPRSEKIGLVYSRYYWVTSWFEDPGSNVITIPPPEPEPYQPQYDRGFKRSEQ